MLFLGCPAQLTAGVGPRPLHERMGFSVLLWSSQNKVVQSIVLGVPIFVVHMRIFRGRGEDPVFVLPAVGGRGLYLHIHQPLFGFMQSSAPDRKHYTNLVEYTPAGGFCFGSKRLIGAIRAARGVVVSIAVRPLLTYNRSAAIGAGLK